MILPSSSGPGKRRTEAGRYEYAESPRSTTLADGRHQPVEPDAVEAAQHGALRRRDLEADDAAARAHDAHQLAEALRVVGQVAHAEGDGGGRDLVVADRQVERVAGHEPDVRAVEAAPPSRGRSRSMFSEKSTPVTSPASPTRRGQLEREVAGAAADVEPRAAPRPTPRLVGGQRAPAAVEAGRHHAVHRVVRPGDAVEHHPHPLGGQRAVGGARLERCRRSCPPPLQESAVHAHQIQHLSGHEVDRVLQRIGMRVEAGHRRGDRAPASRSVSSARRWITDSGVSRGTSTRRRSSFSATPAARWIRLACRGGRDRAAGGHRARADHVRVALRRARRIRREPVVLVVQRRDAAAVLGHEPRRRLGRRQRAVAVQLPGDHRGAGLRRCRGRPRRRRPRGRRGPAPRTEPRMLR